jgi:putative ABC transport system permease protein
MNIFSFETIEEVYSSISRHKTRSFLTGFSITWGIFILVILLGAGNGFRTGMLNMFSGYVSNSIWVSGNYISEAKIGGMQSDARVRFNGEILRKLKKRFVEIQSISAETGLGNNQIAYKANIIQSDAKGIGIDYMNIKSVEIEDGRFFNTKDYGERRRVVIIGNRVKDLLFENEYPVGKQISIAGVYFLVVGILKGGTIFSMMEQNSIYIPDVTLFHTFNIEKEHITFGALLHENTSVETFESQLRAFLAKEMKFNKNDKRALYVNNIQLQVKAFNTLFDGINIFLWLLGICFLLSGMIGITNIMLVVVKERTIEIGIRKAIGATPMSIIQLIISEALIITICFGIIGILTGYLGMQLYNWIIIALQTDQQAIFEKAFIENHVVLTAFVLLILTGMLAGVFPAQKAAKIMPVEALNRVV